MYVILLSLLMVTILVFLVAWWVFNKHPFVTIFLLVLLYEILDKKK